MHLILRKPRVNCFWRISLQRINRIRGQDKLDTPIIGRTSLTRSCESERATEALTKISGKWKLKIIFHLLDGKKRFSELRRLLSGISRGMLTFELRQLMNHGIIERTQYPTIPPTVEYELTDRGRSLRPILEALYEWGRLGRELQEREISITS